MNELRGPRVLLRCWRNDDVEPFAALNADTRVMEHLPQMLSRDESAAMIRPHTGGHRVPAPRRAVTVRRTPCVPPQRPAIRSLRTAAA
jgi:hypothetical protein